MTYGSPVLPVFRIWLFAEVLFTLGAALSIALDPANTASNFAWPVKPVASAALIGALYLTVAPAILLAFVTRAWEDLRVVILPAALFTFGLWLATHLHWEKFSVGTTPFWIWYASYLLPPPIFIAMYLLQQRRSREDGSGRPLPRALRLFMFGFGGLIAVEFLYRYINPASLIADMPWEMTPLVARVVAAFVAALAAMTLSAAVENDTRRARLVGFSLVIALPAVLLQMARFPEGIDSSHWRIATTLVVLGLFSAIGLALIVLGAARR